MELIREKGIPYCDGKGGLQMERGSRYRPIYAEKDRSDSSSSTRVASDNDTSPPQTLLFRRGGGKGKGCYGIQSMSRNPSSTNKRSGAHKSRHFYHSVIACG